MSAVRHYTLEELQQKQEKAAQRQTWLAESAKRAGARERALKKKIAQQEEEEKKRRLLARGALMEGFIENAPQLTDGQVEEISQLEGLYGSARSATILNNADNLLYLGGADVATARYVGDRANLPAHSVLDMNVDEALLFQRGRAMRRVRRYRPEEHGE